MSFTAFVQVSLCAALRCSYVHRGYYYGEVSYLKAYSLKVLYGREESGLVLLLHLSIYLAR